MYLNIGLANPNGVIYGAINSLKSSSLRYNVRNTFCLMVFGDSNTCSLKAIQCIK